MNSNRNQKPGIVDDQQFTKSDNHTLNVIAPIRNRSRSPMFIPGSTASFSDVVRGCSRNNSREGSPVNENKAGSTLFYLPINQGVPSAGDTEMPKVTDDHRIVHATCRTEINIAEKVGFLEPKFSSNSGSLNAKGESVSEKNLSQSLKERETPAAFKERGRSPTRRKNKIQITESGHSNYGIPSRKEEKRASDTTKTSTLSIPTKSRTRSKSPLYVPGESARYSDVLKGMSGSSSVSPARRENEKEFTVIKSNKQEIISVTGISRINLPTEKHLDGVDITSQFRGNNEHQSGSFMKPLDLPVIPASIPGNNSDQVAPEESHELIHAHKVIPSDEQRDASYDSLEESKTTKHIKEEGDKELFSLEHSSDLTVSGEFIPDCMDAVPSEVNFGSTNSSLNQSKLKSKRKKKRGVTSTEPGSRETIESMENSGTVSNPKALGSIDINQSDKVCTFESSSDSMKTSSANSFSESPGSSGGAVLSKCSKKKNKKKQIHGKVASMKESYSVSQEPESVEVNFEESTTQVASSAVTYSETLIESNIAGSRNIEIPSSEFSGYENILDVSKDNTASTFSSVLQQIMPTQEIDVGPDSKNVPESEGQQIIEKDLEFKEFGAVGYPIKKDKRVKFSNVSVMPGKPDDLETPKHIEEFDSSIIVQQSMTFDICEDQTNIIFKETREIEDNHGLTFKSVAAESVNFDEECSDLPVMNISNTQKSLQSSETNSFLEYHESPNTEVHSKSYLDEQQEENINSSQAFDIGSSPVTSVAITELESTNYPSKHKTEMGKEFHSNIKPDEFSEYKKEISIFHSPSSEEYKSKFWELDSENPFIESEIPLDLVNTIKLESELLLESNDTFLLPEDNFSSAKNDSQLLLEDSSFNELPVKLFESPLDIYTSSLEAIIEETNKNSSEVQLERANDFSKTLGMPKSTLVQDRGFSDVSTKSQESISQIMLQSDLSGILQHGALDQEEKYFDRSIEGAFSGDSSIPIGVKPQFESLNSDLLENAGNVQNTKQIYTDLDEPVDLDINFKDHNSQAVRSKSTSSLNILIDCLKKDNLGRKKLFYKDQESSWYAEREKENRLNSSSVVEYGVTEMKICFNKEHEDGMTMPAVNPLNQEIHQSLVSSSVDSELISSKLVKNNILPTELLSGEATDAKGSLEVIESFETDDTTDRSKLPKSSFDTLSSKEEQSVEDICFEITGSVADLHPKSAFELSAMINIESNDPPQVKNVVATGKQTSVRTQKVIIQKTVNLVDETSDIKEHITVPCTFEEILEQSESSATEFRDAVPMEQNISNTIIKRTVVSGKEVVQELTESDNPELPVEGVTITEIESDYPENVVSSMINSENISDDSELPVRSSTEHPIVEYSIPPLSSDGWNNAKSLDNLVFDKSADEIIVYPREQEVDKNNFSNLSSKEMITTVQSSIRTTVKRVRRVIKKVIIKDGKEEVTEEILDEPEEVEVEKSFPTFSVDNLGNMGNVVQVVETPETGELCFGSNEIGNIQTSVHSVTRKVKSFIKKIQIVDGKEVITEEIIENPTEFTISHVENPSVLVSHQIDFPKEIEDSFSNSPDILVNVPSNQNEPEYSSQNELTGKNIQREGDKVTDIVKSGPSRVIRKVVIVDDSTKYSQSPDSSVEITEVSADGNFDQEKNKNEASGSNVDNWCTGMSPKESYTESNKEAFIGESTKKPTISTIEQFVITSLPGQADFILMEREHTEKNSSDKLLSKRFASEDPNLNVNVSCSHERTDNVILEASEEIKPVTETLQKTSTRSNLGVKPKKTVKIKRASDSNINEPSLVPFEKDQSATTDPIKIEVNEKVSDSTVHNENEPALPVIQEKEKVSVLPKSEKKLKKKKGVKKTAGSPEVLEKPLSPEIQIPSVTQLPASSEPFENIGTEPTSTSHTKLDTEHVDPSDGKLTKFTPIGKPQSSSIDSSESFTVVEDIDVTSSMDDNSSKPTIELSVRVTNEGKPVVELFTAGGHEVYTTSDMDNPQTQSLNSSVISEEYIDYKKSLNRITPDSEPDNTQTLLQDSPVTVFKETVEFKDDMKGSDRIPHEKELEMVQKSKSKKKKPKVKSSVTEPIVSITQSLLSESKPSTTTKSNENSASDEVDLSDISKRKIKKARRILPAKTISKPNEASEVSASLKKDDLNLTLAMDEPPKTSEVGVKEPEPHEHISAGSSHFVNLPETQAEYHSDIDSNVKNTVNKFPDSSQESSLSPSKTDMSSGVVSAMFIEGESYTKCPTEEPGSSTKIEIRHLSEERAMPDVKTEVLPDDSSKPDESISFSEKKKKKKKNLKDQKKSKAKNNESHVTISATLASDAVESSSNLECILPSGEPKNVSLTIQHTEDTVNVSATTGHSDKKSDALTHLNVNVEYGTSVAKDDSEITKDFSANPGDRDVTAEHRCEDIIKEDLKSPSDSTCVTDLAKPTDVCLLEETVILIEHINHKIDTLKLPPVIYKIMLGEMQAVEEIVDITSINNNINKLKESSTEKESEQVLVTTVMMIMECLETITYKMYSIKKTTLLTDQEKLNKLRLLQKDIVSLEESLKNCGSIGGQATSTLTAAAQEISNTLNQTESQLLLSIATSEEFTNSVNNLSVLFSELSTDIDNLAKDSATSTEKKLQKLNELEEENEECLKEVCRLKLLNSEVENAFNLGIKNRGKIISLKESFEQNLALTLEYIDTLAELEQVTIIAEKIVDTKPTVNSLKHLQDELQKDRKFFANLTRCQVLLESLESHLDNETRSTHRAYHTELYDRASKILDLASNRAEALALAGSKWTVLESTLKEERAWLGVAAQRVPGLAGVTSSDYDQYISLYQALSGDVSLHSGRIWHILCVAHALQELVTCQSLEMDCEELRTIISQLESRVAVDLGKLCAFKHSWTRFENLNDRIEHWLSQMDQNDKLKKTKTNIIYFWELKAEYEVYSDLQKEACFEFDNAVKTVPIADESALNAARKEGKERWVKLEALLLSLEEFLANKGSAEERLKATDEQLKAMDSLLHKLEETDFECDEQLSLRAEQLQVLHDSVGKIQEDLAVLGPLPVELADNVGQIQSHARTIEENIASQLKKVKNTENNLEKLRKAFDRLTKDRDRAIIILERTALAKQSKQDHLLRVLDKCQILSGVLAEDRNILDRADNWVKIIAESSPVIGQSLVPKLSKASETQSHLETTVSETLAYLLNQARLWDTYVSKRDSLRSSVRQANYMMDLLAIKGRIDYQGLLKATQRLSGVSKTLEKMEGNEVWAAAEELKTSLGPCEASAAVDEEVSSLQSDLETTTRQLREMCTKYRRASELWVSARSIQQQLTEGLNSTIASIQSHPFTAIVPRVTDEEKSKLRELEVLAEEIATQIGVDRQLVLGAEVDSLGERLKDVEASLDELATIQALAPAPYRHPPSSPLAKNDGQPNQESVESLVTLRDHLISLGKSQPFPDGTLHNKDKLQLWEELFRSTFQEYHRVSSQLANTGEANTLVKLWRDYLDHVNAFLSTPIPDEYHSLSEHTSLCQAHQNVIGSQHTILENKKSAISKIDKALVEEFNTLTNLHNETLAKIMERQNQVQGRIGSWERYREQKGYLLSWLSEMEGARGKLNLRYLKVKMVPKVLLNIQDLLDKMADGETHEKTLREHLTKLLNFCEDETLAKSLRLDQATIAQRVTNMTAALNTWKGYIIRVNEYIRTYESQSLKISNVLKDIQQEIPNVDSLAGNSSESDVKSQLQHLKNLLLRLSSLSNEFETLNETEDRLREYISPSDTKIICQKVWLIKQQHNEMERQIEMLISSLEEKLQVESLYTKREAKFHEWVKSVETRLEERNEGLGKPGEQLAILEMEVQAEICLKKMEVEWLLKTGESLKSLNPSEENELTHKKNLVSNAWDRILNATQLRANKLRALIQSTSKLEHQLEVLRQWLETMESKLAVPFFIKNSKKEEINRLNKEQDALQKEVDTKSSDVADILNSCEIILNDCASCHVALDTRGIVTAMENTEKRWKSICVKSAERKMSLKNLWGLILQLIGLHKKQQSWLKNQDKNVTKLAESVAKAKHNELPGLATVAQKLECELRSGCQGLSLIEELYSKVASSACVDLSVTKDLSSLLMLWYNVRDTLAKTCRSISCKIEKINRFNELQSEVVVGLSAVDALLTIAEASRASSPSKEAAQFAVSSEITKAMAEMARLEPILSRADVASEVLLSKVTIKEDKERIENLVEEYKSLWNNVSARLSRLNKQMVNQSVEVDTLKFEADKSTQVDTLEKSIVNFNVGADISSISRKEAYLVELNNTKNEFVRLLKQLETSKPTTQLQLSKNLGGCQSTLELVKHLSGTLMEECGATPEEALKLEVEELEERFKNIQATSRECDAQLSDIRSLHLKNYRLTCEHARGRLTCPLCSAKNWKQFDNDIWRLEQWLLYAEGFFASQPTVLPSSMELLEDTIQDHRELMLDLDSHHRLVVSLNIVGSHLAEHAEDQDQAETLKKRLDDANNRWERTCSTAGYWHSKLQQALIQNEEFHENMANLVEWLESTETAIRDSEPVDLTDPTHIICAKYNKFQELRAELERCEPRVRSLEEAANEALRGSGRQDTADRLAHIRVRLESLCRLVGVYILKLGAVLGDTSSLQASPSLDSLSHQLLDNAAAPHSEDSDEVVDTGPLVRSCKFFGRVVRASLPISALLLLVLGATTLIPVTQDDFSCTFTNNLLTSFTPVLRYPYGRPPI